MIFKLIILIQKITYFRWGSNQGLDEDLYCELEWYKSTISDDFLDAIAFFCALYDVNYEKAKSCNLLLPSPIS